MRKMTILAASVALAFATAASAQQNPAPQPAEPSTPAAPAALEWMAAHQAQLADTIFAMDRRAKQAELDRGGPDAIASPEVVNRIGQAAMVQAHARFLVEALAAAL